MSILIAASEVGSTRALLPVCYELLNQAQSVAIDRHGYFLEIEDTSISNCFIEIPDTEPKIEKFLRKSDFKTLIFSVNVHDSRPLMIARIAQSIGMCTLHVLDYWNGYRSRMELDGNSLFKPTRYLVPDEYAAKQAVTEGIDEHLITVTGQPALAETHSAFLQAKQQANPLKQSAPSRTQKIVLFICEPVAMDQGRSVEENKAYRGYVEQDSLKILIEAADNTTDDLKIAVLPHPRQDPDELVQLWTSLDGDKFGEVMNDVRGRDLLPFIDGVAGMASTLLYEAWLLGIPVLSIQPNLRNDSLRMMQDKTNVVFIDSLKDSMYQAREWLNNLTKLQEKTLRIDLENHLQAPSLISKIALSCDNEVKN